jgi:hypothetical protein
MPAGKECVLVALTGWGQEEDRRRTQDAGFQHHLVKPVAFETIQGLLAKLGCDAQPNTVFSAPV